MKCYNCETEVRWVGDTDVEDEDGVEYIHTLLECPKCKTEHSIYVPLDEEEMVFEFTPEATVTKLH